MIMKYPKLIQFKEKNYWRYLDILNSCVIYIQPKLDGSLIRFYNYNNNFLIGSKNRDYADDNLKKLFNEIPVNKMELLKETYNLLLHKENLNTVIFGELFGRKNTPAKFHVKSTIDIDFEIFDIFAYKINSFLDPAKLYQILKGRSLILQNTYVLIPYEVDYQFIRNQLLWFYGKMISDLPFLGNLEGVVLKVYQDGHLYAFKFKPHVNYDELNVIDDDEVLNEIRRFFLSNDGITKKDIDKLYNRIKKEAKERNLRMIGWKRFNELVRMVISEMINK